ncbi:hypothetical protein SEA_IDENTITYCRISIS_49 [Mycobacterium phage IdentityCrisis]|uniref:Uncharacterized protein n=1 Tax=Mycobacterium phage IdentityCrisis TaxID=2599866 RepID=A0A5J6TI38_9CAUD|nr:hypothetical protein QEH37_gp48 [Mycobacterium phage IdentityCrisis]QFG10068.1 hypothetical protein SEA_IDENTITYCRISIS_49 [Mycobacterium phage IdentityCrisis]
MSRSPRIRVFDHEYNQLYDSETDPRTLEQFMSGQQQSDSNHPIDGSATQ